ncbi:signal recognition particle receptor subunit alpha-like [Clavelina lepadiformis]|uniref:signal recognition particle receptor subunit alpha-like n=1 Tax=Clavelina lepadiformis TaxID=159417 RepID=UPI004042A81F
MLDFFTIFSKGGLVLWCYTFQGVKTNFSEPINALIKSVILQERGGSALFNHGALQMKYKLDNEFELVFVVGYQKILSLLYVDKFIDDVHRTFRDRYRQKLLEGSLILLTTNFDFESMFTKMLRNAEETKTQQVVMKKFHESDKAKKTVKSLVIDQNKKDGKETENKAKVIKKGSPKSITNGTGSVESSPKTQRETESPEIARNREKFIQKRTKVAKATMKEGKKAPERKGKLNRVWDKGGTAKDTKDLDYSAPPTMTNGHSNEQVEKEELTEEQRALCRNIRALDDDDEDEEIEELEVDEKKSSGGFFSVFRGLVGAKGLTKEALQPALDTMGDHLIAKNVAADIAKKMCDSVATKLEGKVLGTFSTIAYTVKQSLNESLVQILTPKRRVDILRDVLESQRAGKPYVITFCGVNGVGKSTNLAKICFWLMENGFRVLIAACDTFRAGAVEQLRTHTARLSALHPPSMHGGRESVHLFEKGYGKDAAGIAMQAINTAREMRHDVVLVDTAGRMQDNEPLMRALAKLIAVNSPDLVLFVGEALVGNEAVDQLVKFNQALADHSNVQNPRTIDGIVLTKFDTIDDKVGAAISMTYTTGQPIVFVGTGQSYPDLRSLNAKAVVNALLK